MSFVMGIDGSPRVASVRLLSHSCVVQPGGDLRAGERSFDASESIPMPISKERLVELADLPECEINTFDIPETNEGFFRIAQLRQPKSPNAMASVGEQKAASVQVKGS